MSHRFRTLGIANIIAIISIAVGVIGVLIGVYSRTYKEITATVLANTSVIELRESPPELKFYFGEKEVKNLYLLLIKFENTGKQDIGADAFDNPLNFSMHSIILDAKIIQQHPANIGWNIKEFSGDQVVFNKSLLKKEEYFLVKLYLLSPPQIDFSNNRIKDTREIKVITEFVDKQGKIALLQKLIVATLFVLGVLASMQLLIFSKELRIGKRARRRNELLVIESLRIIAQSLFGGSSKYRFTVLVPDKQRKYIYPKYRYIAGEPSSQQVTSKVRFTRGVGLAGLAWEEIHRAFTINFPFLSTEEEFYKYHSENTKLPLDLIASLSHYMRMVRSIFSYGLVNYSDKFIGVLSIDSTEPEAFYNLPEDFYKSIILLETLLEGA